MDQTLKLPTKRNTNRSMRTLNTHSPPSNFLEGSRQSRCVWSPDFPTAEGHTLYKRSPLTSLHDAGQNPVYGYVVTTRADSRLSDLPFPAFQTLKSPLQSWRSFLPHSLGDSVTPQPHASVFLPLGSLCGVLG